ncbi:MAG: FtsX-like permease family protein [Deltaproteobacteria bacterium]|nr:FtsX-like permease family protein [Deltaproteobacteria bacterium]
MRPLLLFLRLYGWFSLRYMRQHPVRALIVVLGIALGAAVFTSVRLSVHATIASYSRSMDRIAGRSDLALFRPGGRVPEEVVAAVVQHPDVAAAAAFMTTYVEPQPESGEPFLLVGLDPVLDRDFREWSVHSGRDAVADSGLELIREPATVFVSATLAEKNGWTVGERVHLMNSRHKAVFKILGILDQEGLALAEGGAVAITDIASFQEFTGLFGVVDRIDLVLCPAAAKLPREVVESRLASILPPGIRLASPSESKETGQAMIGAYQLNLSILSFASLFVGMFLVYSLVALNAATRRHELAVLRSTGAAPTQLFFLFLAEGAFLGLLGWLCAFPVSGVLVRYLLQGVSRTVSTLFVRVHVDTLRLDAWEILLSFGVTILISLLAAYQPAREAMRVPPKEVLTDARQQVTQRLTARRLAGVSLLLITAAWPLTRLPAAGGVPFGGYAAVVCLFVGFALLAPYGLQKTGGVLAPVLRGLGGIPAWLAGRYLRDSGTRSAISVGALITAVALFAALVIMVNSFRGTVELWVQQTVSGDLFVTTRLGSINRFRDPLPPAVVSGLKQLDAPVDLVANRRFVLTHAARFVYELDVMDIDSFLIHGGFVWVAGDPLRVQPQLIAGEGVIVSEVFSNRSGLAVGDLYRTQIESAAIELPILGIVRDYRTNGGVVFYHLPAFRQRYFDPGWSGVRFFFRSPAPDPAGAVRRLREEVVRRCGDHIDMVNGEDLRGTVLRIFDETFAVTTVLLIIALMIAALGITTTLAVQVLERSRQLNTLLALGADRGQIRAMIFWEAILLIIAGEIAGLVCGLILSYVLIYVINVDTFGWSFLYRINWRALAMSVPLIMATAILAALPAIRLIFSEPPATLLRER